jgi:hypothetical protein
MPSIVAIYGMHLGGNIDCLIVKRIMETQKTYDISLRLELDEDDEGCPVVKAIRTGENEFIIDIFDGAVWKGHCFTMNEQISLDAKNLWSYDGY